MKRALASSLLALACGCPPHSGPGSTATTEDEPSGPGSMTTTAGEPPGTDTGDVVEICIDDYVGHQDAGTALELDLDTTDTAVVVLGDGVVATPAEHGADQLMVCGAARSDFFAFDARCPGRLSLELRASEGIVPDLVLHDDSGLVEHIEGAWSRFFLKPLQRRIEAGTHVIEVRHAGGDPSRYTLAVMVLPTRWCR